MALYVVPLCLPLKVKKKPYLQTFNIADTTFFIEENRPLLPWISPVVKQGIFLILTM